MISSVFLLGACQSASASRCPAAFDLAITDPGTLRFPATTLLVDSNRVGSFQPTVNGEPLASVVLGTRLGECGQETLRQVDVEPGSTVCLSEAWCETAYETRPKKVDCDAAVAANFDHGTGRNVTVSGIDGVRIIVSGDGTSWARVYRGQRATLTVSGATTVSLYDEHRLLCDEVPLAPRAPDPERSHLVERAQNALSGE